jgi:hypothetical protein
LRELTYFVSRDRKQGNTFWPSLKKFMASGGIKLEQCAASLSFGKEGESIGKKSGLLIGAPMNANHMGSTDTFLISILTWDRRQVLRNLFSRLYKQLRRPSGTYKK